ncbi:hypothetical protein N9F34_02575 [Alphaproteobacteria bacterium]|nr:hypothetical protein [Alphaproteobacteria bacterium]
MSLVSDTLEGLLQTMLENSPVGISIASTGGVRLQANPEFAAF